MKKVKIFGIILIMLITSTGWAATYTTVRVNPASSYKSGSTRFLSSIVRGQSGSVAAVEAAVLSIPSTRAGYIAAAIACAGITYGADKLFEYLASEGFPTDPTTGLPLKVTSTDNWTPNPNYGHVNCLPTSGYECNGGVKYYPSVEARNADLYQEPYPNSGGAQPEFVDGAASYWNCVANSNQEDKFSVLKCGAYSQEYAQNNPTTTTLPATQGEVASAVTDGIDAGNPDADGAFTDALNRTSKALEDLNDTLRKTTGWPTIQGGLDDSISTETKTSLDTKLADPNAPGNYATNTTTTTTNTTSTTNNTTYNTTTNNYYENEGTFAPLTPYSQGTQTNKSAFEQPEVGDFSQLMSDFIDTMQNTDLFSLPGLMTSSIPTGGDCQLTINLGSHFGGTKTISFCEWATALSYIKAVLLCLASVVAVGIVCKGGTA